MNDESKNRIAGNGEPPLSPDAGGGETRREVLGETVRKALYAIPVVLVLAAAPENAWASAPASGTCVVSGGACDVAADCCSVSCNVGMMTCNPI